MLGVGQDASGELYALGNAAGTSSTALVETPAT
jgi:hypothetical protein